jgi:hypothetical protein
MSIRLCSICGERIPHLSHKMLDSFGYTVIQQEDLLPFVNAPAEALPFYFCNRHSKSEVQLWLHEAVYCDRKRLKHENQDYRGVSKSSGSRPRLVLPVTIYSQW